MAWERYRVWVTTEAVTDADLVKEVARDLIERASTAPPDPDHPVELTPTKQHVQTARSRKKWARAAGSVIAAVVMLSFIAQAVVVAPLLVVIGVVAVAVWLWHVGR